MLDEGYEAFQPSNLEITTIDIGNPATNVIPAEAKARLNIRFNPTQTGDGLIAWLNSEAGRCRPIRGCRSSWSTCARARPS